MLQLLLCLTLVILRFPEEISFTLYCMSDSLGSHLAAHYVRLWMNRTPL